MLWIITAIAIIMICFLILNRSYNYWNEKGVPQGNPTFILGDFWGTVLQKHSFADMVQMVYNTSKNSRYCGMYQFFLPTLVLRDPDLIKQVTVKDFDHFLNHRTAIPEDSDPLWSKNVFALTNQKWHDMRTTLSPAFTSSKMKYMFSLIVESSKQFVQHFLKQNEEVIAVEMKDNFTRFANDVIASTAFGIKCDSLEERNNEFYLMGKEATDFTGFWNTLKIMGYFMIPRLFKFLQIRLFSKRVSDFFTKLVKENIASREKQGIVRPDMINLLMEARKHSLKHEDSEDSEITKTAIIKHEITDEDIVAQALLFFFNGFDSVSSLMCFMSHELAVNSDIQEKLREEIDVTLQKCDGKLTYDGLVTMKYMDMVVSETLRKWPNPPALDRVCTKPYTIEPKIPDEKPLHLEEKSVVWLPLYALHRDPNYFPDPNRFNPERFSDNNKANIRPCTYLPFGSGPRNCIGNRFGLIETKALFFHILLHFEFVPIEKTQIPLKLSKKPFTMTAEDGFWLGLKRRAE